MNLWANGARRLTECLSCLLGFSMSVALSQVGPDTKENDPTLVQSSPWAKDGERFQSYGYFRDELVFKMLATKQRLALISGLLADGDLATALFSQRIKGLNTLVLLDAARSRAFNSRHDYLARALVPTHLINFEALIKSNARAQHKTNSATSFVVLDNEAWAISTWFEESTGVSKSSEQSHPEGSSRDVFVEPARFTADEIWNWQFNKGTRLVEGQKFKASPSGRFESRQKFPNRAGLADEPLGTTVAKKLPRETRIQKLRSGKVQTDPLNTGSTLVPVPPANETDVIE